MSEKLELKPCPFCGRKVKIHLSDTKKSRFAACEYCHISTPKYKKRETVIRNWNLTAEKYKNKILYGD